MQNKYFFALVFLASLPVGKLATIVFFRLQVSLLAILAQSASHGKPWTRPRLTFRNQSTLAFGLANADGTAMIAVVHTILALSTFVVVVEHTFF